MGKKRAGRFSAASCNSRVAYRIHEIRESLCVLNGKIYIKIAARVFHMNLTCLKFDAKLRACFMNSPMRNLSFELRQLNTCNRRTCDKKMLRHVKRKLRESYSPDLLTASIAFLRIPFDDGIFRASTFSSGSRRC